MTKITKPGFYPDMSAADYFAEPCPSLALTNSTIKLLLEETPADAFYDLTNPDARQANAAMRVGDAVHQMALGKGRGYRVGDFPRWDRRITAVAEFLEGCERDGVTAIKEAELKPISDMAAVVRGRIESSLAAIAKRQGVAEPNSYQTEVVFAWKELTPYGEVWCRGMADVWCADLAVILDPKRTAALTDNRIAMHAHKQGWPRQAAWYERGVTAIRPDLAGRITFANLLVKPKPPYTSRAVTPMESWRTAAERECERALGIFARCSARKEWPGYPEGIEYIEAPGFALRDYGEDDGDDND